MIAIKFSFLLHFFIFANKSKHYKRLSKQADNANLKHLNLNQYRYFLAVSICFLIVSFINTKTMMQSITLLIVCLCFTASTMYNYNRMINAPKGQKQYYEEKWENSFSYAIVFLVLTYFSTLL